MAGLGTEQALAGVRCEEASSLRVEAVREGAAAGAAPAAAAAAAAAAEAAEAEAEVVGMGEALVLLVDDVMGVVEEVVVEEEQEPQEEEVQAEERGEKPLEQGPAEPGRGPATSLSPLEALEALQLELEPVNKQARRAYSRLKLRIHQRRKPHLEQRSTVIQGIPGFWVKAFVNHPRMSAMMTGRDKDLLRYMTDLKVEELRHPSDGCKITLSFGSNPYFQNEVIVKEYLVSISGYRASQSTPVQWHQGFEREAYRRRQHNSSLNFFNWFSDHSPAGSSRIAEALPRSSVRTCGPIPCTTT
ncbi:testis-specific Y-encoded protein 4-like [Camelus dromedarius]|uniref:testis-specific Y-encoded protein 4-like n=1 Tax=Camelus dromedarius TaxID=9838 RepID=UPI00311917F0